MVPSTPLSTFIPDHQRRGLILSWLYCFLGSEEMPDIDVPSNTPLDRLNEIIVGWYRSKAHEAPSSISEVNKRTGVETTTVSRQNAFLQDVGLLQKEGNLFRLTEMGASYAKFLDFGQIEEAKRTLRTILSEWKGFQQVYDYLDLKGPLSREELADRIGLASDKKPVGGTKTGINAIIDLLLFAGIVVERENGLAFSKGAMSEAVATPLRETPSLPKSGPLPTRISTISQEGAVRVEIKVVLDNSLDATKLEELLKIVRKVLLEPER